MLLHSGLYNLALHQHHLSTNSHLKALPRRTTTRDVDYIRRSFTAEWQRIGIMDATERLQSCIQSTARHFHLGADWMNSDADIALPMANDPSGKPYDPIYTASIQPNNVHLHTVFSSPNGMFTLISVTPFWAVALKLVRYTKWDPGDICLLLRNGTNLSGTQWSTQMLESWLFQQCWPMGYDVYDWRRKDEMKARIAHAIQMVSNWNSVSVLGNPGATAGAEPAVRGIDKADWSESNPPFVPPPLSPTPTTEEQQRHTLNRWLPPTHAEHAAIGRAWTGPPPSQSAHRRSRSRGPTPDPDDWEIVPFPRSKSRQAHGTPHPKPQTRLQPHIEHFDRSIATMLHVDRGPVIPAGVFATKTDVHQTSSRKKYDKKRAMNLKRARLSKWFGRGYDSADGGSESDVPDDSRSHSQHLDALDLNRHLLPEDDQQRPHVRSHPNPSAWQIYAQPPTNQPQLFAAPHIEPHSHQLLEGDTSYRRRRRPPSLDLLDTEPITNSLGLLNLRQ